MEKLSNKQVKRFLNIRGKELAKTLRPEKYQDKEHLESSAELIAWLEMILALNNKIK